MAAFEIAGAWFLAAQRQAFVATHDEVMTMMDRHGIFSMGKRDEPR
ncbi:hypothetical protein HNR29_006573 [Rhizobium leguminosarum]|nr:hypothetical protein [Rhizobium leguminosarum]